MCGHYECGGVKAAMTTHSYGLINKWLSNIKDVYRLHRTELDGITSHRLKTDRLVELNVQEQVTNLAKTDIIQKAWKNENRPDLHGWVYSLSDGIINPVFEIKANTPLDPIFEYDNL